ncbi:MAG: hypothetical protein ACOYMY_04965 [Prochlorococcaceae cyanobacterium]
MSFQRALYPDQILQFLRDLREGVEPWANLDEPSRVLVQLFSGEAHPREVLNRLISYSGPQSFKAHHYRAPLHLAFGEVDQAKQAIQQLLDLVDSRELPGYLNEVKQSGFYHVLLDLVESVRLEPSQHDLIYALLVNLDGIALWRLDPVHAFLVRLLDYCQLPPHFRPLIESLHRNSSAFQALKVQTDLRDVSSLVQQTRSIPDSQLTSLINAFFLVEASTANPQLRQRALTARRHLPTLDPNYFYWSFDSVVQSPADPAAHAPLIGNLHVESLFNRIYVGAGMLIHGTKLLRIIDNYTYIGVCRFLFSATRCIDLLERVLNSSIRLQPATVAAAAFQLRACSSSHNLYVSPRRSTLIRPIASIEQPRTAVLCSGQARGFRETLPALISNIVAPLQADLLISLWKDPGFPRGTHANRLSRMLPQQYAALNASGLLTDTAFAQLFPCTYQALIPDQISVVDEVTQICDLHPYSAQRIGLPQWSIIDVEDEQLIEADANQRTGIQHPPAGCNQYKMFYKFARLASLLRQHESVSGPYDRIIWLRPDFLVHDLDIRLVRRAGPYYYTSFGSPAACGDYLLIGDRNMIDIMSDGYLQGDIYKQYNLRDPFHRSYTGSVFFGGPELLARKFYQHGRSYLSTRADELRHGGLRAYTISARSFASTFLEEVSGNSRLSSLGPAELAIVEQLITKSGEILSEQSVCSATVSSS